MKIYGPRPEHLGALEDLSLLNRGLDRQRYICIVIEHHSQLPWSMGRWLAGCLILHIIYRLMNSLLHGPNIYPIPSWWYYQVQAASSDRHNKIKRPTERTSSDTEKSSS